MHHLFWNLMLDDCRVVANILYLIVPKQASQIDDIQLLHADSTGQVHLQTANIPSTARVIMKDERHNHFLYTYQTLLLNSNFERSRTHLN